MTSRFEQFCTAIFSIQHSIAKIERLEMEQYGLKSVHAQCLRVMEQNPQGITAAQLCETCEKDKAAISRTLAELENLGMITRIDPNGKRYRSRLYLTEKGLAVAEQVCDRVHQAIAKISEGYDIATRELFVHEMQRIAANLQDICKAGQNENTSE